MRVFGLLRFRASGLGIFGPFELKPCLKIMDMVSRVSSTLTKGYK